MHQQVILRTLGLVVLYTLGAVVAFAVLFGMVAMMDWLLLSDSSFYETS